MLFAIVSGAAAAAAAVFGYMTALSFRYRLDRSEVMLDGLPESFDGVRLLFISDLHRRSIPEQLIARCREAGGADLVLVGGDMREKGSSLQRCRDNMRLLRSLAPVYAVFGNNDYDEDIRPLEVMLEEERVRALVNEAVLFEKADGAKLRLVGVDDPRTKRDRLLLALNDPAGEGADYTILLAHDPGIAERLPHDGSIDLILSGDTHGGQIVLPVIGPIVRRRSVVKFRRGWFDLRAPQTAEALLPRLFVSCGFGTSGLPIRLGAPPELHIFTLRRLRPNPDQGQSRPD